MPRFGFLGAVLLVLVLSACSNRVASDAPWFAEADSLNAPRLRDGLWAVPDGPDCKADTNLPAERWPDCMGLSVVRGNQILLLNWIEEGEGPNRRRTAYDWNALEFQAVPGDPAIIQHNACPYAEEAGDQVQGEAASAVPSDPYKFCYEGLRPEAIDAEGRVIAYVSWPVLCGPLPTSQGANRSVTDRPFAGLHVVFENCLAESSAAVRNAARQSEAIARDMDWQRSARWVREGYH